MRFFQSMLMENNRVLSNDLFIVRCPSCGKDMKYKENLNTPRKRSNLLSKSKRCVFCGRNFKVRPAIIKRIA